MKNKLVLKQVIDGKQISDFLSEIPSGQETFRYFKSRPFSIFRNHVVTYILYLDLQPVAYGHLEVENENLWLGIAVSDTEIGKGYGKILMEHLISDAKTKRFSKISLTVDEVNRNAIGLYKKYGFELVGMLKEGVLKYELMLK